MPKETAFVTEELSSPDMAVTSGGIAYVFAFKCRESGIPAKLIDLSEFGKGRGLVPYSSDLIYSATWNRGLPALNDLGLLSAMDLATPTGPTGLASEIVPPAWNSVADLIVFPRVTPTDALVEIPSGVSQRQEPVIRGKGVPVWAIVSYVDAYGLTPEEASELWNRYITPNEVRSALVYWRSHPEVRDELADEG